MRARVPATPTPTRRRAERDARRRAAPDASDGGRTRRPMAAIRAPSCHTAPAGRWFPDSDAGSPEYPSPGYVCISYLQSPLGSSIVLTTDANGKPLMDGNTYAVGVAAFDEMGNVGPMSNLACGEPVPTDTFLKLFCQDTKAKDGAECSGCRVCNSDASSDVTWNVLGWAVLGSTGLLVRRRLARRTRRNGLSATRQHGTAPSGTASEKE